MDRFIRDLICRRDGDLNYSDKWGIAWQHDQDDLVPYDQAYFDKCAGYEDEAIAVKINAGRVKFVNDYVGALAPVLDIGIGSGEFIKKRGHTMGFDVNPVALDWLRKHDRLATDLSAFGAYTFWDVIEHVPTPEDYLQHVKLHAFIFVSLPIFEDDLSDIRSSKHYRPGEHLYYWTEFGLLKWFGWHGFRPLEGRSFETAAGREGIRSFAFKRCKWPSK